MDMVHCGRNVEEVVYRPLGGRIGLASCLYVHQERDRNHKGGKKDKEYGKRTQPLWLNG